MYDKEFNQLFKIAENRVDDMDIILSESKDFSIKVLKQEVETFKHSNMRGIGVRILKDGKIGYSYTEEFSDQAFNLIIDEAIENSKIIEKEELAIFKNYENRPLDFEIYNPEINNIKLEDKIQIAKDMEKYCYEADSRVKNVIMSIYGDGYLYYKIANTKGLNKEYQSNSVYSYVYLLVEENGDKRNSFEIISTRDFSKINAKEIAEIAVKKAIDLLGQNDIESGQYPIVFNNDTASSILSTFCDVFNAKVVQDGKSLLKGKINEKIAADHISIVDDPRDPDGFDCSPFDGEGFPTQKTVLVENGILKSFMHNTITAEKDKVTSTGSGARSYKSSLSINKSNFKLIPDKHTTQDLLNKNPKTIEIVSLAGLHSGANMISGDFSLSAEGYFYENGLNKGSLKQFTVSGNFFDVIKNIDMIANNFKYSTESVGSASILVNGLTVSS